MPLYTYIAHYRGRTRVEQDRRSNYRGFAPFVLADMARNGLLGPSQKVPREMLHEAYRSPWTPIANRSNVWRTAFLLQGSELELYAIHTKD
jgi:hypothetical protein